MVLASSNPKRMVCRLYMLRDMCAPVLASSV